MISFICNECGEDQSEFDHAFYHCHRCFKCVIFNPQQVIETHKQNPNGDIIIGPDCVATTAPDLALQCILCCSCANGPVLNSHPGWTCSKTDPIEELEEQEPVGWQVTKKASSEYKYKHDIAEYIHHGYPSLYEHYDRVEQLGIGIQQECDIEDCVCHYARMDGKKYGKADPARKSQEAGLVTSIVAKVKAEREAADIANEAELMAANATYSHGQEKKSGPFDFQCYTPDCGFATNDKSIYERHVITRHYGKGLCYAGKVDLKSYGWAPQGRKWEV
jgi:hypothetical protein